MIIKNLFNLYLNKIKKTIMGKKCKLIYNKSIIYIS